MQSPAFLLLPLASSLLYVAGALLIKRAADLGVGVWRTAFVANLVTALAFAPLLLLGGRGQPASQWWQPALVGVLMLVGQVLAFFALSRGDVSVATPILGVKTVLVAAFTTWVLGDRVPLKLWCAAGLTTLALALLNRSEGPAHRRVSLTLITSLLAAGALALFDVLVQKWSPAWGAGRFLPVMAFSVAAYSLVLLPFFKAPLRTVPRSAWPWLLAGAGFIALQSVILIVALAVFGEATAINIVYSSRGLWSVAAVWLVGHWFANREQQLGHRVLRWRLAGAVLITSAIVLVLI